MVQKARHNLGREHHVLLFRARRNVFVNQSSSLTVQQDLLSEIILHVQNIMQRCSTLDLAKDIVTYAVNFSVFSFLGTHRIILGGVNKIFAQERFHQHLSPL